MKLQTQYELDFTGRELAEAGLNLAIENAESKIPDWKETTWRLFKEFLNRRSEPFLIEDFRSWVAVNHPDYNWPPTSKAFGFIPLKAARENLIIKVGYGVASNAISHCRPSTMWKKL